MPTTTMSDVHNAIQEIANAYNTAGAVLRRVRETQSAAQRSESAIIQEGVMNGCNSVMELARIAQRMAERGPR